MKKATLLIYQPVKNAMQSGSSKSEKWCARFTEYDEETAQYVFDLMNWVGGFDVLNSIVLPFNSKDMAIEFAKKHGFKYEVEENLSRALKPKSYAENFN